MQTEPVEIIKKKKAILKYFVFIDKYPFIKSKAERLLLQTYDFPRNCYSIINAQ